MAVRIMEKLSADEIEYQQYLAREKYLLDEMSKKMYAEYKMKSIKEELEAASGKLEETSEKLEETSEKLQKTEEELQLAKSATIQIIINMLLKRFERLPDEYVDKIKKLPNEALEQLGIDLFDLKVVDDLEKYIN